MPNLVVLACHRTVATTTPDLHSKPWGLVVLPRPLRLTLHLGARHFLNASIASDAFDSTYQTHETTDGLQNAKKNCKVHPNQLHQTEHHVFTTCLPRVHHVFTTCSPSRVYHVFTTCSPRVLHVCTMWSPRVALGLVNQVTERDEGGVEQFLCATVPEWFTDSHQNHKPCRPLTRSSNPGR